MIFLWYKRKLEKLFKNKNTNFIEESISLYSQLYNHKNEKIKNLWNIWLEKSNYLDKEDFEYALNNMQINYNRKCLDMFLSGKEKFFDNQQRKNTHIQRVLLKLISLGKVNDLHDFLKNENVDTELKLHIMVDIALKNGVFSDQYNYKEKELFESLKIPDDYFMYFDKFDQTKLYYLLEYYKKNIFDDYCTPSTLDNHSKPYLYVENLLIERDVKLIQILFLPNVLITNRRQILLKDFYRSNQNELYKILYSLLKREFEEKEQILEDLLNIFVICPLSDLKIVNNQELNIDKFFIAELINQEQNYQINEDNLTSSKLTTKKFWFLEGTDYYHTIEKYEQNLHLQKKLPVKNITTKLNKI